MVALWETCIIDLTRFNFNWQRQAFEIR